MRLALSADTARRVRVIGGAIVLLVLVTAPFERWYLVRRANAMQERIFDLRRAASARYPEGWQRDRVAVDEVAELEYRRAQVRHRIVTQLTFEGWTLRLLAIGAAVWVVGALGGSREPGAVQSDAAPPSPVTSPPDSSRSPSPDTAPGPPP